MRSHPSEQARGTPGSAALMPATVRHAVERARPLLSLRPLLVVSDFDGTLAGLSSDPWAAEIVPSARRGLRGLARHPGIHVRLLSGRGALDLAGRVGVARATYLGDHGAERAVRERPSGRAAWRVEREAASEEEFSMARRMADAVPLAVPEPWLVVERKDPTICFHFRTAPDADEARTRVGRAVDRIDPLGVLQRSHGRRSLELRPHGATTKSDALRGLLGEIGPAAVIALGDDPHDGAAFGVIAEARRAGSLGALVVAVASHPEWTTRVGPLADVLLADAGAAGRFLASLARVLGPGTASAAGQPHGAGEPAAQAPARSV